MNIVILTHNENQVNNPALNEFIKSFTSCQHEVHLIEYNEQKKIVDWIIIDSSLKDAKIKLIDNVDPRHRIQVIKCYRNLQLRELL